MEHRFSGALEIFESPDCKYLSMIYTKKVKIYDADRLSLVHELELKNFSNPSYIAYSPNMELIAIKNTKGHIAVFSLTSSECIVQNELTNYEGEEIYFDNSGEFIISCDWNGHIYSYSYTDDYFEVHKIVDNNKYGILSSINKVDNFFYFYFRKGMVMWEFPFNAHKPIEIVFKKDDEFYDVLKVKYARNNDKIGIIRQCESRVLVLEQNTEKYLKQILLDRMVNNIDWSSNGEYLLITCESYEIPPVNNNNLNERVVDSIVPLYHGKTIDSKNNVMMINVKDGSIVKYFEVNNARFAKFDRHMSKIIIGTFSECTIYSLSNPLE